MADGTPQNGTATVAGDEVTSENGVGVSARQVQRVKLDSKGTDGSHTDTSPASPFPVFIRNDSRKTVNFSATNVAAGATGTETLISLVKGTNDGATANAASTALQPPAGKRFRITSITFAARGNATATAQITTFTLRQSTAGLTATSVSSGISARVATPATANAWDRFTINFGEDGPEMLGDGTLLWGISANAVYTTNAPTWDVLVTGHEYS